MPTYAWTCQVCGSRVAEHVDQCVVCAAPASLSAIEIEERRARFEGKLKSSTTNAKDPEESFTKRFFGYLILGLFLLTVGISLLASGDTPGIVGVRIVSVAVLLVGWLVGDQLAAIVVGLPSVFLALVCVWLAFRGPLARN